MLLLPFTGLSIVAYLLWALVLAWTVSLVLTIYGLSRQRPLLPVSDSPLQLSDAPAVSVIVPARNEEHRVLGDSIRSILAQDYRAFEVIAIDDRSTDNTGSILRSLAQTDKRLHVIDGKDLPPGWLGKPHAMHQALKQAHGEWILATDADIIFEKEALRTALATARAQDADAISLIPFFQTESFWEHVMIQTWAWVTLMFTIAYRIDNPKTPGALGVGGFFLMRHSALARVGGYEALKNEVVEDVRLAEMIKRSGGRMLTIQAPHLLRTRMYQSFGEIWESCTRTWFSGMKFSFGFALVCAFSMYVMALMPPLLALISAIAIVAGIDAQLWQLFIPAMFAWLMQIAVLMMSGYRSGISAAYALTAPLGLVVLYTMLLDSSIKIQTRRGVTWKGRLIYDRAGVTPPNVGLLASNISKIEK
jgi:cellulose synthase/poly-beta-1,6-N-acetylglucosamine synthase-like glycosyltransferase